MVIVKSDDVVVVVAVVVSVFQLGILRTVDWKALGMGQIPLRRFSGGDG